MKTEKKAWAGEVINDTTFAYQCSKSYRELTETPTKFHKAHYQFMNNLVNIIDYQNVIYKPITEIMELLNINDRANLLRSLDQVSYLVEKISSRDDKENVKKGWLKIIINPEYGWRVSQQKSREQAIKEYRMLQDLSETSKRDITLTPYYQALKNSQVRDEVG